MPNRLSEELKILEGVAPQDIATADVTGPYHDVTEARKITGVLITGTIADTQVVTIELLQATDSAGTSSKSLKGPKTVTASGAEKLKAVIEAEITDMDMNNDFTHVAVKVTSDDPAATPPNGAAVLLLGGLRYSQPAAT